MNAKQTQRTIELAAFLAARRPDMAYWVTAGDAVKLARLARRLHRLAEQVCDGIERYDAKAGRRVQSWTEADDARNSAATGKALEMARSIAAPYWVAVAHQSGPRGLPLSLRPTSGPAEHQEFRI